MRDQCEYKATRPDSLKKHKEAKHEGRVLNIMKAELKKHPNIKRWVPDMYVTRVSIWHKIRKILSETKYINIRYQLCI